MTETVWPIKLKYLLSDFSEKVYLPLLIFELAMQAHTAKPVPEPI